MQTHSYIHIPYIYIFIFSKKKANTEKIYFETLTLAPYSWEFHNNGWHLWHSLCVGDINLWSYSQLQITAIDQLAVATPTGVYLLNMFALWKNIHMFMNEHYKMLRLIENKLAFGRQLYYLLVIWYSNI